jgi:hypothetical protein
MPRLGGVAVFLGFCLPWAGMYLVDNFVTSYFREYEKLFAALIGAAAAMLGKTLVTAQTGAGGKQVNRIYIEDGADIEKELYLSLLVDRGTGKIAFVVSTEGGMDIEAVAHDTPDRRICVCRWHRLYWYYTTTKG